MFIDIETALRIERAECALNRAVASAVLESGSAPLVFAREIGSGIASYLRPGSPLNKLIGFGVDGKLDEATLTEIEDAMSARQEPTRIELSSLAHPRVSEALSRRGYRLCGFEHALVKPLRTNIESAPLVRVERATGANSMVWRSTIVAATCTPDETGCPVDEFPAETIEAALDDFLRASGFIHYLAYLDNTLAGAASMRVEDGVALLGGSATLLPFRRRGVQTALIAARLRDARAHDAELAVVTTAPGSRSQANLTKHGFSLAHARAVLISG